MTTKPIRLTAFNHKGGVGKTTLTLNVALALTALGKKVLLVDSDPQCNLTAHLIETDLVDELLNESDLENGKTLWSALKPLVDGDGDIKYVEPIERQENLFIIPGDIRLSEFEVELTEFWGQCLQRRVKGYRGISALRRLVTEVSRKKGIDYVFYDAGPNIGPLNRTILLDVDNFIVPVACDLFSLRALSTLGRTLITWVQQWQTISGLAPEGFDLLPGRPQFLGFVPGRYRVYGGVMTRAHGQILSRIESGVRNDVAGVLKKLDPKLVIPGRKSLRLGEIKDYGVLVPESQNQGTAIGDVSGVGTPEQRQHAKTAFDRLARRIVTDLEK